MTELKSFLFQINRCHRSNHNSTFFTVPLNMYLHVLASYPTDKQSVQFVFKSLYIDNYISVHFSESIELDSWPPGNH